ncbi:siroheme synthase [candidate division BRC1 bacterium HGW-BRC1-1]|jgi:siroheme synthase-like protein|nr:MAG: siroheme synthase [candidate division BRC1 bacterium HGW-BRC1-1]
MTDSPYYPLSLNLHGCRVLVAGGGPVATRKVRRLVEVGAKVLLVSPDATEALRRQAQAGEIEWQQRAAVASDVAGCTLVFAATSDVSSNEAIAQAARVAGIPVNRADAPQDCDFLVPALMQRGAVTLAITTGGQAPALAKWVRRRLEATLGPDLEAVSHWFVDVRREVLQHDFPQPIRAKLLRAILDSSATELAAEGRTDEALAIARELMEKQKQG